MIADAEVGRGVRVVVANLPEWCGSACGYVLVRGVPLGPGDSDGGRAAGLDDALDEVPEVAVAGQRVGLAPLATWGPRNVRVGTVAHGV